MGQYKFGKLAPRLDDRTLKMAKYTKLLAPPPVAFDNLLTVKGKLGINNPQVLFPMDGNDRLGDCTIAGIAHATTVYNGLIGSQKIPLAENVIKYYFKITHCKDTGCNELDVLRRWKKKGFEGEKPIAYGSIDPKNHMLVKQCIQLFGGVYLGFEVQEDCMKDFDAKKPWTPGPILPYEGHAVYATSYDQDYITLLTWGDTQKGTWDWWDECVDEAYAILPPEAEQPGFAPGFDFETLKADLLEVTNNNVDMKSKFLTLNLNDFWKGLLVAGGTALLTGLYQVLQSGGSFDWVTLRPVVVATVGALVTYIVKNLFTNSAGQLFKREKLAA
jgi:hypothetical protein